MPIDLFIYIHNAKIPRIGLSKTYNGICNEWNHVDQGVHNIVGKLGKGKVLAQQSSW